MSQRILSLLLAMLMVVTMLPVQAFAADPAEETLAATEETIAAAEETLPPEETAAPEETTAATDPSEEVQITEPAEETQAPEETQAAEETQPEASVPETEATQPVEETLPAPAEQLPEIPADAVVKTWIQRPYGFDIQETSGGEYLKQYNFTPCSQIAGGEAEYTPDGAASRAAGLPTPQNVKWSTTSYGMLEMTFPTAVDLSKVDIMVMIYRNGEFYTAGSWWLNGTHPAGTVLSVDFIPDINHGGTYYATVQLLQRNGSSGASEIATSSTWNYVQPSDRLATPGGLHWLQGKAAWNSVTDAKGYYIHWNSAYGNVSGSWFYYSPPSGVVQHSIPEKNSGLTKFKVRALANLATHQNSEQSGWSEYNGNSLITDTTSYTGNFKFYSEVVDRDISWPVTYKDTFFAKDSSIYNHDLARASLKLAMSAFPSNPKRKGGVNGDARNAYAFMKNIGIREENIKDYGYNKEPEKDSIAYVIGSKYLKKQNSNLLVVAVRGQGYKTEWAGNFDVGPNVKYHQGFETAARKVMSGINEYIASNPYITGNVTLWITGYSRAGATANMVAGFLDNGEFNLHPKVSLASTDLFAYTFEAPAGIDGMGNPTHKRYSNIFNIVNPIDFVPKLAPENWYYGRYGIDCFLPDLSKEDNASISAKYKEITGKTMTKPFKANLGHQRQSLFLDKAFDKVSTIMGGEMGYCGSRVQGRLIDSCIKNKGLPSTDVLCNVWLDAVGLLNLDVISIIVGFAEEIKSAHFPELCLAHMETLTNKEGYKDGKYKYYIVKCPVDIEVTDASGATIGAIENDAVTQIGNENVELYVDSNGDKYVYILDDSQYNLNLTATDDGTMDCTVVSYQSGQGKTEQTAFFDVPLVKAESYNASFSMENNAYSLTGSDGTILPDVHLTADQMNNTEVSVSVVGNGTVSGAGGSYSIGDTADLNAAPAEGNVFAGWYENGDLISREEHLDFSVKGDRALKAVFLSTEVSMKLDREYLAVQYTPDTKITEQLTLTADPAEWMEYVTWSVDPVTGGQNVIQVSQTGEVTVLGLGTAYAVATASFKGYEYTARCRIDVTEDAIDQQIQNVFQVNGVQLGTPKADVSLYSADYAEAEVLLLLPQNMSTFSVDAKKPADNGAAIASARFTDPDTDKLFALTVKDDRTVLIVPREEALTASVKGNYQSAIAVTVNGTEFVTADAMKLSVKNTLPKLKAAALTLNPFYLGDSGELTVTGGTIEKLWADPDQSNACPEWLELNGTTVTLKENAPTKGSAKLSLLADVAGYTVPVAITADVKLKTSAPQLKLSASTVTLQENISASSGAVLKLQCKKASDVLADLQIQQIIAPEGYYIEDFNADTGTFRLCAETTPTAGKITLQVKMSNAAQTVPLTLTVKVAQVKIQLRKSSISLGWYAPYSEAVAMTVTPSDYVITEPGVRITDKTGKLNYTGTDRLNVEYRDGMLYVGTTEYSGSEKGDTYKVWISPYEDGPETALTVKVLGYKNCNITSTIKASGTIDLTDPNSSITVTPSYKNYVLQGNEDFGYKITAVKGKEQLGDQTDLFEVKQEGAGSFTIAAKEPGALDPKCKYTLNLSMITENLYQVASPAVVLKVKQTAVSVKPQKNSLTINPYVVDPAIIAVTANPDSYALETLNIRITDKSGKTELPEALVAQFQNGHLTVSTTQNTEPGQTYKIHLQAFAGQKESAITVNVLSEAKSAITAKCKVSGTLDVIRPDTAITVDAPVFKNFNGMFGYRVEHRIIAFSGKTELGDYTNKFVIGNGENGANEIRSGGEVDHTLSYKLRTVIYVQKPEGGEQKVSLADTALKIKMGSAAVAVQTENSTLYAKDIHSRAAFHVTLKDRSLSGIDRIEIKDDKYKDLFEIISYKNGEFAIGFADAETAKAILGKSDSKSVTLNLNVFLKGNETDKANAAGKLKLDIVK